METTAVNNSNDSAPTSPARSDKGDSQFTPAVRQFSAPKAFKDAEYVYVIDTFSSWIFLKDDDSILKLLESISSLGDN